MRGVNRNALILLLALSFSLTIGDNQPRTSLAPFAFASKEEGKPEVKKEGSVPPPAPAFRTNSRLSSMPYTGLAEKNIFNPERKEFPTFATPETVKKPQARPQVILYGVTLAEDYQSASIVQTGRTLRKGEREIFTLRAGEQIGEYRLAKIMPDRIVLEGEGDSFEVLLNDPSKPKQRAPVRTETKPATVTSTIPGPTVTPPTDPVRLTPLVSPVTGQEKTATPGTPPAPQAVGPAPAPAHPPATRSTSPAFIPRRGSRVVPTTPGVSTPQPPDEPQGGSP